MDPLDKFASLEELGTHEAELVRRLQEIDTEFSGKALPEESRSEWNEKNGELDETRKRMDELKARTARLQEIAGKQPTPEAERIGSFTPVIQPRTLQGDIYDTSSIRMGDQQEIRDRAMKAIEIGRYSPDVNKEDAQAAAERVLSTAYDPQGLLPRQLLATGSPTYERAFFKTLAGRPLTNDEVREMNITTAGDGGALLPFTLDPTIILTSDGAINPMRQISRVVQTATNQWKGVTGTGGTARYTTESAEAGDNSPSLAQPVVDCLRADYFIPFTVELEQDFGQLRAELGMLVADAKDVLEADKFINGTATTEPEGLMVGATITVNQAATALAFADAFTPKDAVPPRFQSRGVFLANGSIYSKFRGLATTETWAQFASGDPDRFIGYSRYVSSEMPSTAGSAAAYLTFGDFGRGYLIVDRVGMSAEVIPHLFGTASLRPIGQRGFYAMWRNSGTVLVPGAFASLIGI